MPCQWKPIKTRTSLSSPPETTPDDALLLVPRPPSEASVRRSAFRGRPSPRPLAGPPDVRGRHLQQAASPAGPSSARRVAGLTAPARGAVRRLGPVHAAEAPRPDRVVVAGPGLRRVGHGGGQQHRRRRLGVLADTHEGGQTGERKSRIQASLNAQ